jgi:hypothetical protein
MPDILTFFDLAAGGIALVLASRFVLSRRVTAPCPPGPKGLPLIGNVLDMPTQEEWLTFADWATHYGMHDPVRLFRSLMSTYQAMSCPCPFSASP